MKRVLCLVVASLAAFAQQPVKRIPADGIAVPGAINAGMDAGTAPGSRGTREALQTNGNSKWIDPSLKSR